MSLPTCIAVALLAAAMGCATRGEGNIYEPGGSAETPRAHHAELVELSTPSGHAVYGLYAPAPPGARTLVYFHGNGQQLAGVAPLVDELAGAGLGVFAVEYPGFGLAREQTPNEANLYQAAEAALRGLASRFHVERTQVVLVGMSLGTGIASEMARRGLGGRLVLLASFSRLLDGKTAYFDTLGKAPSITVPALVIHGTRDELFSYQVGEQISLALPQGHFLPILGAHHSDIFHANHDEALHALEAFARGGERR